MASASQRKAERISQKLTFLKDQGDQLIGAVGQYVCGIIATGESWTQDGDNTIEYQEICQMVETAVEFLWDKCEEVSGASVSVAANQLSRPSGEQPDPISQPSTATVSGTSNLQKSTPQISTVSLFNRETTETVHSRDEIQLKPILARIAVIEEALCSFRGNSETSAEQQSGTDQQLKELLSTFSESDKKNNSRFKKVKQQIKKISNTQDEFDQEHEGRLQSLEKELQKLCATQDRIKLDMKSHAELTEKLVHKTDELGSLRENINVLEARIGGIIDDCSNKNQDVEMVTQGLKDKVIAITESVQFISEDQERKTTLLRELETRLQILEADRERNVKDVQKQAGKGETNFRILCQMLNDRLTPLEQLRTCLNQRVSTRDEDIKTLSQVIQEMSLMSPRLQQLELKFSRTRCGFTAFACSSGQVAGDTIKEYMEMLSNVGGNFNADCGIFTAPVDGLYVTSVSLCLVEGEALQVIVRYKVQGQGQSSGDDVCWCSCRVKDTQVCNMGVVDMQAGDTLSLHLVEGQTSYRNYVWFSCFFIGRS